MGKEIKPDLSSVAERLAAIGASEHKHIPSRKCIRGLLEDIQCLMFPDYFPRDCCSSLPMSRRLEEIFLSMKEQIALAFLFTGHEESCELAERLAAEITEALPLIKDKLTKDITALYEGDPAAICPEEVVLCYPGFYAISIYRIAHEFYIRKIPIIPRIMTEYAHEKTGIDIHAGADIGEYFFIDHGTGIVIGETTTIGKNVKIYQGVTLGAKSFELDESGNPVKGIKRHPDIGNNVVIYANATILGGNTKIGDGCVIGANVWLTRSVAEGQTVYYTDKNSGGSVK